MNKGKAKELYAAAGLNVAASARYCKGDELDDEDLKEISAGIGIPCVVKPTTEGSPSVCQSSMSMMNCAARSTWL